MCVCVVWFIFCDLFDVRVWFSVCDVFELCVVCGGVCVMCLMCVWFVV